MVKARKPVKYLFAYLFMLALIKLIRSIPRRTAMAITKTLAATYYCLSKKNRHIMVRNLKLAFGNEKTEREIEKIARNVYAHFAVAIVDVIRIPNFINEGIGRYIQSENMDILKQAQNEGKGVIVLTGHFGNWELMGAWMAQNNQTLRVVGAPLVNPWLDKLVVNMRNKAGYQNIPRGQGTREILRSLKRKLLVGMLIDQDINGINGVFVDFFGKKAHTPTGPLILAARFKVPIIPMFMHVKEDLTYHVTCYPPIELIDTGNPKADLIANTQKCSDVYEMVIRQHPEQWAWFHRRWKRQPAEMDVFETANDRVLDTPANVELQS